MKNQNEFSCKCCGRQRYFSEIRKSVEVYKEIYKVNKKGLIQLWFRTHVFEWACDLCINEEKAITRNPKKVYGNEHDAVSFFDQVLTCSKCEKKFLFSKQEKKYWFEELKFYPLSHRKECFDCRKKRRDNNRLSELLKEGNSNLESEEIEEIIEIYSRNGKEEKVRMYQNRLKEK